jgi:GT2 family glycosyltransferase
MDIIRGSLQMTGSIVIVARNSLHLTKLAVRSALSQDVPCDILVMDNNSKDDTMHWLRTKRIAVSYAFQQKSLAACWNSALKSLWMTGNSEALVCNNDIELRPDTYRLLSAVNRPFVTGVSIDASGQLGTVGDRTALELLDTASSHPDMSCFMIRKSVTDRVGWFDESFFPAYCEDGDYHIRMHRAGIKALGLALPVLHHRSSTLNMADEEERMKIMRGADNSRRKFRNKYGCDMDTPEYARLFI